VTGDLTVRDQTHPVTLDVEYLGAEKTPWGTSVAVVSASAEIDRDQWGLTWNVALESGGVLVSKKIQLEIEAEIVPAPAAA
jgi:polyisoprenoid-binding protein YceI